MKCESVQRVFRVLWCVLRKILAKCEMQKVHCQPYDSFLHIQNYKEENNILEFLEATANTIIIS